jgi:hypothetical protein
MLSTGPTHLALLDALALTTLADDREVTEKIHPR